MASLKLNGIQMSEADSEGDSDEDALWEGMGAKKKKAVKAKVQGAGAGLEATPQTN